MCGTVRAVEEIEMPNLGNVKTKHCKDPDEVKYYGLKITTEKGRAVVDFRNNSNGYYGGTIKLLRIDGPMIRLDRLVHGDL